MKILDMFPAQSIPHLAWLGRQKGWIKYVSWQGMASKPGTDILLDLNVLRKAKDYEPNAPIVRALQFMYDSEDWLAVAATEALATLVTNGPKQFTPTDEQFESMENVELRIPISDFSSPFPAILIDIPLGARARLAAKHKLPVADTAKSVLIRWRHEPDENPMVVTLCGEPREGSNVSYLFQHRPGNETIEVALSRDATQGRAGGRVTLSDTPGLFNFGKVTCRAALNLCLMLTHFGCDVQHPPKANRKQRRAHSLHGDFLAVKMKQNVVIRAPQPPTTNPPGPGTAIEVTPHWRRGHWRCYPGQAVRRAAGEKVQLLFVKPCLVREDRVLGDLGDSSVTYHG